MFGTIATPDPCMTMMGRFMNRFFVLPKETVSYRTQQLHTQTITVIPFQDAPDNGNVAMFMMGDELWTATETALVTKVDTTNLNAIGRADYKEALAVSKATAHPHTGRDGTVYNMGNSMEKVYRFCFERNI